MLVHAFSSIVSRRVASCDAFLKKQWPLQIRGGVIWLIGKLRKEIAYLRQRFWHPRNSYEPCNREQSTSCAFAVLCSTAKNVAYTLLYLRALYQV